MSERSRTIEAILAAAAEIAEPSARAAYVARICAEDQSLRCEVESLLAAHDQAGDFLQESLVIGRESAAERAHLPPSPAPQSAGLPPKAGTKVRYLGDYELLEEIGSGGMGVIYKARQCSLNRVVAVKMIVAGHLASSADVKRFHAEAQAVASLHHPNIIPIYEVGEHEGQHYFSMRLVEGQNLAEKIHRKELRIADGKEAARVVAKVARAVHYAHGQGVLHRDLKPANILLDADNEPHVADFGLARSLKTHSSLTHTGSVLGTPSFMAPEQAAGKTKHVTEAADIYSLGAVLYDLLAGRPPFVADSPLSTMVQVLESDVISPRAVNPRVSTDLEHVCLRCLEKRPELRYATAADLAEDLERYLRDEPVALQPARLGLRMRTWARRHPALAYRYAVLALCAISSQVNYYLQHPVSPSLQTEIIGALVFWAIISAVCQAALHRHWYTSLVRFLWAGADVALVTAVLLMDKGFHGPLIAVYGAVIAASGLWFRVPLVLFTTGMSVLGYGILLTDNLMKGGRIQQPHWHFIYVLGLIVTGFIVAYQVHRVRALSQFYGQRPLP
jgi:serine/threonine-protein kinase